MRLTLFLLVQADPRCRLGSIWAVAANSFDEAAQLCPGFIRGQGSSAVLCHTSDYSEPTLILELDNWNDNKRPADSVSGETQRGESPTMWCSWSAIVLRHGADSAGYGRWRRLRPVKQNKCARVSWSGKA